MFWIELCENVQIGLSGGGEMTFYIQINDSEPEGYETREAFERALAAAKGKGWVREWQDHGDGGRRMHRRTWR